MIVIFMEDLMRSLWGVEIVGFLGVGEDPFLRTYEIICYQVLEV
jgi:hypothetical protein